MSLIRRLLIRGGSWLTSIEYPKSAEYPNGHAEFFNSNRLNPNHMNMRLPAPNTVSRNKHGWLPYRLGKDSLAYAARALKNPLDSSAAMIAQGKLLYEMYCDHCHGAKGAGDGKVASGLRSRILRKVNWKKEPTMVWLT